MKNYREASIICFYNKDKKILLQVRGDYSKYGEKYAFFGGGADEGETPLETFYREAMEELGLDMRFEQHEFLGTFEQYYPKTHFYAIRSVYMIHTTKKAGEFEVFEGEGAEYFSITEARKLSFPNPAGEILDIIENFLTKK